MQFLARIFIAEMPFDMQQFAERTAVDHAL